MNIVRLNAYQTIVFNCTDRKAPCLNVCRQYMVNDISYDLLNLTNTDNAKHSIGLVVFFF